MENPDRIIGLLVEGVSPSQIAKACEIPIGLVTQQIMKAIQERRVLRSQVLSTLNKDLLDQIAPWASSWIKKPTKISPEFIYSMLKTSNDDSFELDVEEVRLYLICFQKAFQDGEMYEALCEIERTLHTKIRIILIEEYGPNEIGWWRKGVPEKVRSSAALARELDTEFVGDPPYSYTTLINLKDIIENNWSSLFECRLPSAALNKNSNNRQKYFGKELIRLNAIRNKVMHSVRGAPPSEEEFFFVKQMQTKLDLSKWRNK